MNRLNILINSQVSLATSMLNSSEYSIMKVYKIKEKTKLKFEVDGYWKKNIGYKNLESTPILAVRRKNLNQIKINTCLVITHNNSLQHLLDKR